MSTAEIHDLGYKRYSGERRAPSTRWRVIMRHQIADGWKTWWRYKLGLIFAIITTCIAGALLYFLRSDTVAAFDRGTGAAAKFSDIVLPLSYGFYCKIGFIVSLTISSHVVSGDMKTGAFLFYFARSTRPIDYVIGRFAGLCALMAPIMLFGPLLLALMRLGLSDSGDQVMDNLLILPKTLLVGTLATLAYAAIPFAFSALGNNRGLTIGAFAIYYLIFGMILTVAALLVSGSIASVDLATAVQQAALSLFNVMQSLGGGSRHGNGPQALEIPFAACIISLLAQTAISLGFVVFKLRQQQVEVGGAA